MSASRRLAFVCPRFAEGSTLGGAETLLKNLAVRAAATGHEVTFLTTCAQDHFSWENAVPPGSRTVEGMSVTFFPVDTTRDLEVFLTVQDRISRGRPVTREEEMAWLKNNVNSTPLYEHLRQHADDYDAIMMGPYLFGLIYFAAQVAPTKTLLVPCLHDESFSRLETIAEMFRKTRGFMFNTVPERELAVRLYGIDPSRSSVVGMGLDGFDADPTAFSRRHGISAPYVLYSGRREPLKGTPLLVDYMNAFRARTDHDVKLVFTGSGRVEIPTSLAPHVIDVGFVSEEEKHEAMAGALTFCHPSVNESLGIVLLESWLAGTPGLVHAGSEVLAYQCRTSNGGLWFRVYPEFEMELRLLIENDDLRRALGENGRRYVLEEYSWDAVQRRFEDALLRL